MTCILQSNDTLSKRKAETHMAKLDERQFLFCRVLDSPTACMQTNKAVGQQKHEIDAHTTEPYSSSVLRFV